MNDNPNQLRLLCTIAKLSGFDTLDAWAMANIADFMAISASWRILHEGMLV